MSQPANAKGFIDAALDAGATTLKPAAKSTWGFGGVVRTPDGTIWKVASQIGSCIRTGRQPSRDTPCSRADVAAGSPVGAMTPELVASLGAATPFGVSLADRGYLGAGPAHLAVVAGMAVVAYPEVPRRPEHRHRGPARCDGTGSADVAGTLGLRSDRGRRDRPGGPAGPLGVQLAVDAGAVSGHLAMVPDARIASGRPSGLRSPLPARSPTVAKDSLATDELGPAPCRGPCASSRKSPGDATP